MSCHYKLKTTLRIVKGKATKRTQETFTWTRAEAAEFVAELTAKPSADAVDKKMVMILQQALATKHRGKISLEFNR